MAENSLEQLWAEEAEQEKAARMEDLAEVNDDSEEYIEDEENPREDSRHLGAIGSSKPKSEGEEQVTETTEQTQMVSETSDNTVLMDSRVEKLEAAVCNMATWQPMASDIISGNRDLIMQLSSRIEYLETALNQLRLSQGVKESCEENETYRRGVGEGRAREGRRGVGRGGGGGGLRLRVAKEKKNGDVPTDHLALRSLDVYEDVAHDITERPKPSPDLTNRPPSSSCPSCRPPGFHAQPPPGDRS